MGLESLINKVASKIGIGVFSKPSMGVSDLVGVLPLDVDHTTIKVEYSINYKDNNAQGQSGPSKVFSNMGPKTFSAKLIFDTTGLVSGIPTPGLLPASLLVAGFIKLCVEYNSTTHQPNYLWIVWGGGDFKGVITKISVDYSMFSQLGIPMRAEVDITVSENESPSQLEAASSPTSPDMTHTRKVLKGDNITTMCNEIYGNPGHYIAVAKANRLNHFRQIKPGIQLDFPPTT